MLRLFMLIVSLCASALLQAQPYRWVDEKGQVRYTDAPPPGTAKNVTKRGDAAPPPAAEPPVSFELQRAQKEFPVTLYTAPACKEPCELARAALGKRGVPFTEVQVWNAETLEQLKSRAATENVPVLIVGRSVLSAFDPANYDSLLDTAGYPKQGVLPARSPAAPAPPEGYEAPPVAEAVAPAANASAKPGPYDSSGLKGPAPKPGLYDSSGLEGPAPKPGQYKLPGDTK